jgi:hypothetical protein
MSTVLHDLALPTFRRWADRWGWDVRAVDLPSDGAGADPAAQAAKWAKTGLLRRALHEAPLALWLDADVLLLRDDEDVSEHLLPSCFQALALEQVPHERRVNPNTGVWLLRSCPEAFAFLDAVDELGQQPAPGRTRAPSSPRSAGTGGTSATTAPAPARAGRRSPAPPGCRRAGTSPSCTGASRRTCSTAGRVVRRPARGGGSARPALHGAHPAGPLPPHGRRRRTGRSAVAGTARRLTTRADNAPPWGFDDRGGALRGATCPRNDHLTRTRYRSLRWNDAAARHQTSATQAAAHAR